MILPSGLSSSGEFQSKQGWGQHCYFMPAYTATDQTPTKSNWFQGNNQLNQLCFFYFWQQSGPLCQLWRSQFVIEMLRSSHQLSLSFRVVLEIRAIERVMQCIEMQCSKLLMTDRTVAIPPSHLPISLQRRLYLEKNRCRLELLVNHKTEAEGCNMRTVNGTVENWSWYYLDKTGLICTERDERLTLRREIIMKHRYLW